MPRCASCWPRSDCRKRCSHNLNRRCAIWVSAQQATALLDVPAGLETLAGRTWHWLEETDGDVQRRVATLGDATYPVSLLHIEDPPLLLYLMGQLALPAAPAPAAIAIVGSRNPTPQGESNARQFAHAFAQAGLTVISGLALGIDGAAHAGALQGAEASGHHDGHWATIAVVGHGPGSSLSRQAP
jgi:DNA processing protein